MTSIIGNTDASADPLAADAIDMPTSSNNRLLDISLLAVLLVSGLVFYWLATHGTWSPLFNKVPRVRNTGNFFLAQARGMLRGRLWVQPSQTAYDCFIHDGKCYGYFGVTPSVLRLPFLALLDHYNNGFTPLFITAALTLATGGLLASLRHLASRMHLGKTTTVLVALTGFGFGAASVLTHLAQPDVYDEAIAWAVGFLCLALFCFVRWWEKPLPKWYALLLVSLVMAANARPTAIPFALILGLGVGYRLWGLRRVRSADWTESLVLGGAMILLPVATSIGVFVLKFGVPIPSYLLDQQIAGPHATVRWRKIRRIDHNDLTSIRFLTTALFAYLRPDTLDFSRTFPWVYFRFRTTFHYTGFGPAHVTYIGLRRGSLYSGTVSSLTATMPLSFIAAITAGVYHIGLRGRVGVRRLLRSHPLGSQSFWKIIAVVAAVASWCVVLTGVAVEDRFLVDAYPLAALMLLLGLDKLAGRIDGGNRLLKVLVVVLVVAGISWQLLVNIGLAWRYPGA